MKMKIQEQDPDVLLAGGNLVKSAKHTTHSTHSTHTNHGLWRWHRQRQRQRQQKRVYHLVPDISDTTRNNSQRQQEREAQLKITPTNQLVQEKSAEFVGTITAPRDAVEVMIVISNTSHTHQTVETIGVPRQLVQREASHTITVGSLKNQEEEEEEVPIEDPLETRVDKMAVEEEMEDIAKYEIDF
jgi:hypothetical protein